MDRDQGPHEGRENTAELRQIVRLHSRIPLDLLAPVNLG